MLSAILAVFYCGYFMAITPEENHIMYKCNANIRNYMSNNFNE